MNPCLEVMNLVLVSLSPRILARRTQVSQKEAVTPEDVFQRLAEKENWVQVYNDPILRPRILSKFTKLREVYDDIRTKKEIE